MILVTGFEPFQGKTVNASMKLAELLSSTDVKVQILPVVHKKSFEKLLEVVDSSISHIIMLGEVSDRSFLSFEKNAFNKCDYRIADNEDNIIKGIEVVKKGPSVLHSTIDLNHLMNIPLEIPREISDCAGRFVCNEIFYRALHYFNDSDIKIGFFHVPSSIALNEPQLTLYKESFLKILKTLGCDKNV
ncbi:hypothetical protein [Halobacteriovorax sp. HLS]|uniref:pyroglutamyl-peptidase I family protein n=1 Tax=Halobacteriovorax sp. HLS TaxID=2234000 RepID=UPI000FDB62BF|nr:hypothetical protein [Halobacteriovorax sp. HLS]